ncbi:MAG TPA: NAD(P)-dependent oxidoreductase [Phycisphaerales bacterium]|nr:NAD(P)-dependent oxidoreductase [Phycisphaerales bacterium]
MRTLIADQFEQSGRDGLASLGCEVLFEPALTPDALADAVARLDPMVMVVRGKKVKGAALGAGRSLKLVIRAGAGYDNIDLAAASQRGIAVCNCPGMNAVAVAELVMALLLCCDRRVPDQTRELRAGAWNKKEYSRARGLKGLTLGIVGVGAIGREVIRRARAFDMTCLAHSLNMTPQRAADLGVGHGGSSRADLLSLAGACDAVSLHVAANPQSQRMCDAEFFAALRPGAYFINTSRGSVVDEAALAHAVTTKGVRAGLDVFADEPAEGTAAWTSPLAALPGVYTTHHVGASTDQAQNAVADEVVRIVRVWRQTGAFENRVN